MIRNWIGKKQPEPAAPFTHAYENSVNDFKARVVRSTIYLFIGITVITAIIRLFFSQTSDLPSVNPVNIIVSLLILMGLLYIPVRYAGIIISFLIWISVAVQCILEGGLFNPVYSAVTVTIIFSTIITSKRMGFLLYIISVILAIWLYQSPLPHHAVAIEGINRVTALADRITISGIAYVLTFLVTGLQEQHRNLLERVAGFLAETEKIAQVGGWSLHPDGVIHGSAEFYRILGVEPGTPMIRDPMMGIYNPEDYERVTALLDRAFADGTPFEFEAPITAKDGQKRTISVHGHAQIGSDQEVIKLSGTVQDITVYAANRLALQRSEKIYRTITDNIPDTFFYLFDAQEMVTFVSDMMPLGANPQQQFLQKTGIPMAEVFPKDVHQEWERAAKAVQSGETVRFEMNLNDLVLDVQVLPLVDDQGHIYGGMSVVTDISQKRRQEHALQFLADCSVILLSSVDYENNLHQVVQECVRELCDWCSVDMQDSNSVITRIASDARNPDHARYLEEITVSRYFLSDSQPQFVRIQTSDDIWLQEQMRDEQAAQVVRKLSIESFMAIPITFHGKAIGSINFGITTKSRRYFDMFDQQTAEDLSRRISTAFETSTLHRENLERREWFEITLSSIGDAVIATDARGVITFINPEAVRLTEWSNTEAIGQSIDDIFKVVHEENGEPLRNPARIAIDSEQTVGLANHAVLIGRFKRRTPIDDSAAPIRDDRGRLVGAVLIFRDITDRRASDMALIKSEMRFRAIFDAASLGILVRDKLGRTIIVNPTFSEMMGYSETELKDMHFNEYTHPDDRSYNQELFLKIIQRKIDHYSLEKRYIHKNGSIIWANVSVSHFSDPGTDEDLLVTVVENITDRKAAEARLRSSETRLRLATQNARIGIWIWDLISGQLEMDAMVYQVINLPPEPLITYIDEFITTVHPEDRNQVLEALNHSKLSGQDINMDYRIQVGDNAIRWVHIQGQMDYNAGSKKRMISVIYDITERKDREKLESELAIQQSHLEFMQHIASELSHDINTPLTVIGTSIYLLERSDELARDTRYLSQISETSKKLKNMIDDLVSVAKLQDAHYQPKFSRVNISQLLSTVFQEGQMLAEGYTYSSVITPHLYAEVDQMMMYRAFHNILSNAIHYTPKGGTIRIELHRATDETHQGMLAAIFVDNGQGIDEEDLPKIFDRFFRTQKSQQKRSAGSGLGLYITKQIVEAHHGTITVESAVGIGSTFIIYLPESP